RAEKALNVESVASRSKTRGRRTGFAGVTASIVTVSLNTHRAKIHFSPYWKTIVVPSFRVIVYTYVLLAVKLFVLMLKIHCWLVESQRKTASGVVEETVSSTVVTVPEMILVK